MRKRREKIIIYSLTNVLDQVFLARKAKVRKAVLNGGKVLHSILIFYCTQLIV